MPANAAAPARQCGQRRSPQLPRGPLLIPLGCFALPSLDTLPRLVLVFPTSTPDPAPEPKGPMGTNPSLGSILIFASPAFFLPK